MIVPVDEYRVGESPSQKPSEMPSVVSIPQSHEIPQSAAIPQRTGTIGVECRPSMPEMSDGQVPASEDNHGTQSEIIASGTSQLVTRKVSTGMKGTTGDCLVTIDQLSIILSETFLNYNPALFAQGKETAQRSSNLDNKLGLEQGPLKSASLRGKTKETPISILGIKLLHPGHL